MILTVGNIKGGVGKTTLAVNLAIALARSSPGVLLIDGDEQGTALAFTDLRAVVAQDKPVYTCVALYGQSIRTQVRQLAGRYSAIVIDVGGRDSGSLRAALTVSDTVLIPTQPRSFDLWGVAQTADLVAEAREVNESLRALAVLNGADATGKDNLDAAGLLNQTDGIALLSAVIVRRKAWPNAAASGRSVLEWDDPKAMAEFSQLTSDLFETMSDRHRSDIGATSYGYR